MIKENIINKNSSNILSKSSLTLLFCLLLLNKNIQAQDSTSLYQAVNNLNNALVLKNIRTIRKICDSKLSYAHSNGWTERRRELIKNLKKQLFLYKNIDIKQIEISINENIGLVKYKGIFDVYYNKQYQQFNLKVIQIWKYQKEKWKLVSRQSENWIK